MPTLLRDRSAIYANRLFSRRHLDVRARLLALRPTAGRGVIGDSATGDRFIRDSVIGNSFVRNSVEGIVIHARTVDVSPAGAGVTLTRELPSGSEVVLCFRHPADGAMLCLHSVVTRSRGFRAGLRFLRPTAEQRLLLSELCYR
jgi:hypothetical protein